MKKTIISLLIFVICTFVACTGKTEDTLVKNSATSTKEIVKINDLDNGVIVLPYGSVGYKILSDKIPLAIPKVCCSVEDCFNKLINGEADAFIFDKNVIKSYIKENEDVALLPQILGNAKICVGAKKDNYSLIDKVNTAIDELKVEGIIKNMKDKWLNTNKKPFIIDDNAKGAVSKITIGCDGKSKPFNYIDEHGDLVGFDIEIGKLICKKLNKNVEFKLIPLCDLEECIQTGEIDLIISNYNKTQYKSQRLLLSKPYVTNEIVVLVKK